MTRGRGGCAVSTEQTLFIPYRTRLVSKFLANNVSWRTRDIVSYRIDVEIAALLPNGSK